jgi:hypothetical protein
MNNPVWEWLIRSKLNAYAATKQFNGPSALDAGPGWCFSRYGQSSTALADGRMVLIGGEHEDHYDPDFYIYNDVVVLYPDGRIDIFGYPREIFRPTDFHTATLTENRIVIIGSLGYPEDRKPGTTPVMIVDLNTFALSPVVTSGIPPGWLWDHQSALSEDGSSILIQKGKLFRGGEDWCDVENIDDWRLHIADWHWERLTERGWPRWVIRREDGMRNHLFEIHEALWSRDYEPAQKFEDIMKELTETLGRRPDFDTFTKLYRPGVPHEVVPEVEEEFNVFRIKVDGVVARYVQSTFSIQLTVEGDLPEEILDLLTKDLVETLATLENTSCVKRRL